MNAEEVLRVLSGAEGIQDVKVLSERRILLTCSREAYRGVVGRLAGLGLSHVVAITGVDMKESIDLLLHLGSSLMATVRVRLDPSDPKIATVSDMLPGAEMREREVHDLLGVEFEGHPSPARFMVSEDWPTGVFPLRRSFTPSAPEPRRSSPQ
ncbi:MAG: NADH-quinone oxidoreductase subunit C [Candidatus Methanosuratincola sp.]|jgi:NADH-quinone oxidoreductase subunit C|nr:NADH-quinone oxidoreductase subunit C [Candidatus Methanosuratincola sp.]